MDHHINDIRYGNPMPNTFDRKIIGIQHDVTNVLGHHSDPYDFTKVLTPFKALTVDEEYCEQMDDEATDGGLIVDLKNKEPTFSQELSDFSVTLLGDQSSLAGLVDTQKPLILLDKRKVFVDDSAPLENFVPEPYDNYTEGKVVYGSKSALSELLGSPLSRKSGKTGVITNLELIDLQSDGEFDKDEQYKTVDANLGRGSFGNVTLNRSVITQKLFVQKEIFGEFNRREVDILLNLQHINIISTYGLIMKDNSVPQILLEYAGVNLITYVQSKDVVADEEILELTYQGLSALEYLDRHEIFNPDIKPENFCILEKTLKMIDFGSCKTPQDDLHSFSGGWTPEYMAPEACMLFLKSRNLLTQDVIDQYSGCQLDRKYHVYALALTAMFMKKREHVMVSLVTGGHGYENSANTQKQKCAMLFYVATNPGFVKTTLEDGWIPSMRGLLNVMLEGLPQKRPTASLARLILIKLKKCELKQKLAASTCSQQQQPPPPPPVLNSIHPGKIIKQRLKQRLCSKEQQPYDKTRVRPRHSKVMPVQEESSVVTQEMVVSQESTIINNIPNMNLLF